MVFQAIHGAIAVCISGKTGSHCDQTSYLSLHNCRCRHASASYAVENVLRRFFNSLRTCVIVKVLTMCTLSRTKRIKVKTIDKLACPSD